MLTSARTHTQTKQSTIHAHPLLHAQTALSHTHTRIWLVADTRTQMRNSLSVSVWGVERKVFGGLSGEAPPKKGGCWLACSPYSIIQWTISSRLRVWKINKNVCEQVYPYLLWWCTWTSMRTTCWRVCVCFVFALFAIDAGGGGFTHALAVCVWGWCGRASLVGSLLESSKSSNCAQMENTFGAGFRFTKNSCSQHDTNKLNSWITHAERQNDKNILHQRVSDRVADLRFQRVLKFSWEY